MIIFIPIWLRILLSIPAAFKMAELITVEMGPFGIFDSFRKFAGRLAATSKARHQHIEGFRSASTEFAELVTCPFCSGMWVSMVLALLNLFPTIYGDAFLIWMAIGGGQSFMQSMSARNIQD